MVLGSRDRERFWIALIVRFAFGFMFLIAAINIFFSSWNEDASIMANATKNVGDFVDGLSKPYETSWVNIKLQSSTVEPSTGAPRDVNELGIKVVRGFLYGMPFVFAVLSILLLTGLFVRPALRASALFLVVLGLGSYLRDFKSGSTLTTLQDFMYAMFITLALFTLSKEPASVPGFKPDPGR